MHVNEPEGGGVEGYANVSLCILFCFFLSNVVLRSKVYYYILLPIPFIL
jgi:hypothetical protein